MTEEELSLFSEFLEQREYARGTYSGLNKISRNNLNSARNHQAKQVKAARRVINDDRMPEKIRGKYREVVLHGSKTRADILRSIAETGSNVETIANAGPSTRASRSLLRTMKRSPQTNPRQAQKEIKSLNLLHN